VNTIDVLIKRARIAAGISWEAGKGGNKTESQEPEVRNILRECANELERLQRDLDASKKREREYEEKYILPCFKWAKEIDYDLQEAVYQNPGRNCVELLVARLTLFWRGARDYAQTVDNVREALGQKETHYLIMADDVQELVEAVERDDGSAKTVLKQLRDR
jgi:predicted methyltransferase MtxX (methanogen marker protein 4)